MDFHNAGNLLWIWLLFVPVVLAILDLLVGKTGSTTRDRGGAPRPY